MKSDKTFLRYIILFVLYLILAVLIRSLLTFTPDSEFIYYQFAEHLRRGDGLIYNTIPPLVTTYPITPLLLTLHQTAIIIASSAVGGILLVYIVNGRWHMGLLYVLVIITHGSTAAAVLLAFSLAAVTAAKLNIWFLAGILIAVAILTDSSAIVLALLLCILVIRTGYFWQYTLPALLILLAALLMARSTEPEFAIVSFVPGFVTVLLPCLAVFALIRYRHKLTNKPYAAILVAWSAALILLAVFRQSLPGAAVLPGLLALIAILPFSWLGLAVGIIEIVWLMGVFPALPRPQIEKRIAINVSDKPAEQVIGEWIKINISERDTIATSEIGALAYYSDRPIINLYGEVQPIMLDRAFFMQYAPSAVVLESSQSVQWEPFAMTYAQTFTAGQYSVYQRVVRFAALDEHSVDLLFAGNLTRNDLRLRGVAISNQFRAGDYVPVRLDWELAHIPSFDIEIDVKLVDDNGQPIVSALDKVPTDSLQAGKNSTYHLLVLPQETAARTLTLHVGVHIHGGDFGNKEVVDVTVTK